MLQQIIEISPRNRIIQHGKETFIENEMPKHLEKLRNNARVFCSHILRASAKNVNTAFYSLISGRLYLRGCILAFSTGRCVWDFSWKVVGGCFYEVCC